MEGGRRAGGAGHGGEKEVTRPRASRYLDQHDQPRNDIHEPRAEDRSQGITDRSSQSTSDHTRLQRALDMSMMDGNDNDEIGTFQDTSIEPDEGSETDEERLQRALDMSVMDGNYNDDIGTFQDTSIEPDEGNETGEERLRHALDMSMMNENGYEEMVASKENIRQI